MTAKRIDHGGIFERQFRASLPPREVYARKLHSPGPVGGWRRAAGEGDTSFTPESPYDFFMTAPAPGPPVLAWETDLEGNRYQVERPPKFFFALELKSTAGKALPHRSVKPHQVSGLLAVALAGHIAGLVVEFREVGPEGEVWFIPIKPYAAYLGREQRASLPLEVARRVGILIEVDRERGLTRKYWKTREWLRACGAAL